MATKWSKIIDEAASRDREALLEAATAALKANSTAPLVDAGFPAVAQAAIANSESRGKSLSHSLNVVVTRAALEGGK